MVTFLEKVKAYIQREQLLSEGDRVLVGLSGGADSVCLFLVLSALSEELGVSLETIHVHHGLRGEAAERDLLFSQELSRKYRVPFHEVRVSVPDYLKEHTESVEEAARTLRYKAFFEEADRCRATKIALAHHAADQAETVLFQMVRGSALRGLSGMSPMRDRLIRPLLHTEKTEILQFLRECGQPFCEDQTNQDTVYTRNKIRKEILPTLSEIRPDAVVKITELSDTVREADRYLESLSEEKLEKLIRREKEQDGTKDRIEPERETAFLIETDGFLSEPPIMRRYIVTTALRRLGCPMKDKGRVHIEAVCELFTKEVGKRTALSGGYLAVKEYEGVKIRKEHISTSRSVLEETFEVTGQRTEVSTNQSGSVITELPVNQSSLEASDLAVSARIFSYFKDLEIPEKVCTKWFDYDIIKDTLVIRTRREKDRFSTRPGTHKKLKDYMIDEKIPAADRNRIPLLAAGSEILWVFGYRMSEAFKVTERTKTVLEVTIENGGSHERSDQCNDF